MKRKKVGIVIDYSIRIPDIIACLSTMKKEIITGVELDKDQANIKSSETFWLNLHHSDPEAYAFYETLIVPKKTLVRGLIIL